MSQKQTTHHDYKNDLKKKSSIYEKIQKAIKQMGGFSKMLMRKSKGNKNDKRYCSDNSEENSLEPYYVVRRGKHPGLYKDLAQALEQIEGFPNGQMKKVNGYKEALAYLNTNSSHHKISQNENDTPTIYIDGSYVQDVAVSGYGYTVQQNGRVIQQDFGIITDSDMIHLQSLGAEITALIRAMEWAIANNYKAIIIVYDATSVISLIENQIDEKAMLSKGKVKFKDIYDTYKPYLSIQFIHRSEDELFKQHHEAAHHLSRIPYDIITGKQKG